MRLAAVTYFATDLAPHISKDSKSPHSVTQVGVGPAFRLADDSFGSRHSTTVCIMSARPARDSAEVVIVGRGMFGSATARHLAESGVDVFAVGPEAYDPDQTSASSDDYDVFSSHNDDARLTRLRDRNQAWAEVTARALHDYATLEDASGIDFHHDVGCLIASLPALQSCSRPRGGAEPSSRPSREPVRRSPLDFVGSGGPPRLVQGCPE